MVVASWKEPIPGVLMTITINCNNNIDTKSLLFGLSKYQSHMMGKGIHAMINNQYNNQITLKYKQLISFVKVGSRT